MHKTAKNDKKNSASTTQMEIHSNDNHQIQVITESHSETLGLYNSLSKEAFNFSLQTRKEDTFSNSPVGLYGFAFACYISGCSFLHLTNYDTVTISVLWVLGGFFQFVFIKQFSFYKFWFI